MTPRTRAPRRSVGIPPADVRAYLAELGQPAHDVHPAKVSVAARPTLERFVELRANGVDGRALVRELKAVGGDLKALRLALTGAESGPELWAVIAALPRDEALRRARAAL